MRDMRAAPDDHEHPATETNSDAARLLGVLKKIPFFGELTDMQRRRILKICTHRLAPAGTTLIEAGSRGQELFILLHGELHVLAPEGLMLSALFPLSTAGELSVLTGRVRVVSVRAATACNLLVIHRAELTALLENDPQLMSQIYLNAVDGLAEKLEKANLKLRQRSFEIIEGVTPQR